MTSGQRKDSSRIQYVSDPVPVNMGDAWYRYATPDHFWMSRRFQVLQRLEKPDNSLRWAEVGCGNGAVQLQMYEQRKIEVDGIELNEFALQNNLSDKSRLFCYDVFDCAPEMKEQYDRVILLDVLEHIDDHQRFLDAVLFLLRPGGALILNVPAFSHLWSLYDVAQGHVRRYRFADLRQLVDQTPAISLRAWTYWGLPLVPLLLARKGVLKLSHPDDVIEKGFAAPGQATNRMLTWLARCEALPQHFYGTSLMAVIDKSGHTVSTQQM